MITPKVEADEIDAFQPEAVCRVLLLILNLGHEAKSFTKERPDQSCLQTVRLPERAGSRVRKILAFVQQT
ncbi:MAG: hypothetical protein M3280_00840 [Actinomycetota bacterium]|nr:hypothetical protein [Actinomycetota bacterium]